MEKALFDWPIMLQYEVKLKYRLIFRKFFGHEVFFSLQRSLNQLKAMHVCIHSTNLSNRSISVRIMFLFLDCTFNIHIQCGVNFSYCISFTEPRLTPMLNFSIFSNIKTRQEFKKETPLQSFFFFNIFIDNHIK